jgi:sigma-B regulation protein RsbU (phosphoserine phosphatase)
MTMLLRPNPSSGVPVYLQLIDQVKAALATGAFRPGEPLPGIHPLAEELVINPNTVARAYRALEHEGVITLRHPAGAAVAFTHEREDRLAGTGRLQSRSSVDRRTSSELALENSRLTAQIAVEVASRVARTRELELAREVQERLFPQACPPIAGLDYAGACRPALGIGGDYYDFIRLSGTRLGIAIGDVSGKGIAAALLMATLRAYLHGQTLCRVTDLADVMVTLNRLVYDSSSANRYATFFYAQYDAPTRGLEYVNAGHNPPLIFRTWGDRQDILRLETGGPVIGLMPDCCYRQGRVTLEEGDVLVLFTDGITEAMNGDGEEWGEERLTQVIGANRALPARDLIDRITRTSDDFVGGAAQYDDMTLITARVIARGGRAAS